MFSIGNDYGSVYKKVEAMYYKNYSANEIANACGLSKTVALEIMQVIYGRSMIRRENAR